MVLLFGNPVFEYHVILKVRLPGNQINHKSYSSFPLQQLLTDSKIRSFNSLSPKPLWTWPSKPKRASWQARTSPRKRDEVCQETAPQSASSPTKRSWGLLVPRTHISITNMTSPYPSYRTDKRSSDSLWTHEIGISSFVLCVPQNLCVVIREKWR